jgi:transglutaminase superfamily protein
MWTKLGLPHNTIRQPGARRVRPAVMRMPSVLKCGFVIFAVNALLQARGFAGVIALIRRRVAMVPADESVDASIVRRAERAVAYAGAFYPGRAKCLEQSLALYYLLRRRGVLVRYCQGVQFHPFVAHAWIEYRGEVVNDVAEHVQHFTRLPVQLT